jgi:hypothetical protein
VSISKQGIHRLARRYLDAVDKQLAAVFTAPSDSISLQELLPRMRGAFPSVVWDRVVATGREKVLGRGRTHLERQGEESVPELHPLDFEWYFTADCAASLAAWISTKRETVLCLGAPTVAAAAVDRGRSVILVDRNPLVAHRLPALLRASKLWLLNIADARGHLDPCEIVMFDAPWYPADICEWLNLASHLTNTGGLIAFSLFPSLVRSTARRERELILEFASRLGQVSVFDGVLVYNTPLFESEALGAIGLTDVGNWRRGDLVVIRKRATLSRLKSPWRRRSLSTGWRTYVIGRRVVKLRPLRRPASARHGLFQSIPNTLDYVYDSVSMRDTRRHLITLWTSRNRVAEVTDPCAMGVILGSLERGEKLATAIRHAYPVVSSSRHADLEENLAKLLD